MKKSSKRCRVSFLDPVFPLFAISLLFPFSSQAWADDAPQSAPASQSTPTTQEPSAYQLQEVTVYGDRLGPSQKELSTDAIADVQNTGGIGESLDQQSGLETEGLSSGKGWSVVSIRGQSFRATLVLLNGQRVNHGFDLSQIPTEDIEKVEVLEGPEALAYGPDAEGGVINIITRTGSDHPWGIKNTYGDFGTYQFQGLTPALKWGDLDNTLSGSFYKTDGYTFNSDELHWDLSDAAVLRSGLDQFTMNTGFYRQLGGHPDADDIVSAGTGDYDQDGRENSWGLTSSLAYDHPMGLWEMASSLFGNWSDIIRLNPLGADVTSGVTGSLNQYLTYGGQLYFSGPAGDFFSRLKLGVEVRSDNVWSDLMGAHERAVVSLVAQGTLKFSDDLQLDWANRLENYEFYGVEENPTGTLIYTTSFNGKLYAGAGTGFRAPGFDELYRPNQTFNPLTLPPQFPQPIPTIFGNGETGNPNLVPEQSVNLEVGYSQDAGDFSFGVEGFYDVYHDLINGTEITDQDSAEYLYWTYENIGRSYIGGIETNVGYTYDKWLSPYINFTWAEAEDQDTNQPIPGRLRTKVIVGSKFTLLPGSHLDVNARFVDRNPLPPPVQTQDQGSYELATYYSDLNAKVGYDFTDHFQAFLECNNILNQQYATLTGLPTEGRYFQGGVEADF